MRAGPNSKRGHIVNPTSLGAPVQPQSRPASRHCGTGIAPDRDTTGSWRDVDGPARLCRPCRLAGPRAPRGNCRLFDTARRSPARDGLSAGGKWIRTTGPAPRAFCALSRDRLRLRTARSFPQGTSCAARPRTILREPLGFHQRQIGSGAVERRWRRGVEHQIWSELGEDRA